ncbi:MAG TPA: S41 family peptidase [Blastocatellia bacterium]|nr:S41 family peptidase [Blastocatellia bacterium]
MKNLRARLCFLLLVICLCAASALAQAQAQALSLYSPVERQLTGAERHTYTLDLKQGQIAQIVTQQRGIDVVVTVFAPDGKRLFEVDTPNGAWGDEKAFISAEQAGAYRIEVRAIEPQSPAGKYQIVFNRYLTDSEYQTERLAALGRLWGMVKYFHPYLAYKEIDWDAALIKAIPQVKAARAPIQYRQAISDLLQVLNDPATAVQSTAVETNNATATAGAKQAPTYFRVVDGFVVIRATDWAAAYVSGNRAAFEKQPQMMAEINKAKGVLLDCRFKGITEAELPDFYLGFYLNNTMPMLVQGTLTLGTSRYRMHSGYAPQRGSTSGGYSSTLVTTAPGAILGQAQSQKPLAILIDEKTPNLIDLLSGLQAAGAKIVQVGKAHDAPGVGVYTMTLPDGVRARVRTTEFVHPGGGSSFQADARVANNDATDEQVIAAAIASLNAPGEKRAIADAPAPLAPRSLKDEPYAAMSFPDESYRLLALYRFWNVINYFYPYKHLTDKPWATVLTDFIPRFLENKSALDYQTTVAEMVARLQDTHGFVQGLTALNLQLGGFAPPLGLRAVGGKLAIVALLDEAAAQAAGLKVGDLILAIDGEPTEQRIAYLAKLKSLSTKQSAYTYIYPFALRGAKDSKARLRVEGSDGQAREVEIARSVPMERVGLARRKTPIYEVLPSGYGYIDLARLPLTDAHKAMDAMINAPAIIFDMRGYPNGTAWEIAPRLTEKQNVTAARFTRPLQSAASFGDDDLQGVTPDYAFEQKLPPAKGAIYKGKVVMLINEDAISQAEHTCLFFESATNVTFIGTPTNGANGDVTTLVLPGGIYASFSGHSVSHADGRQLQRLGVQPHIRVEPTIKGIREGRDEVLEAALKFLDSSAKR